MKPVSLKCEYDRIADQKRVQFIVKNLQGSILPGASILDVGCGNGVISRHLGKLGYRVTGVDVSEKTIERARSLTELPNVQFFKRSAADLMVAIEKYDAIICSEVLEHLDNPGALLEVMYQALSDNGKLIVTVPNGFGPRELFVTRPMLKMRSSDNRFYRSVLRFKSLFGYNGTTVQSAADNLDHIQFFSKDDLDLLSQRHRFRITRYGKANFIEDVFPFSLLTRRFTVLQSLDCMIADVLPLRLTGGFFTVWEKARQII